MLLKVENKNLTLISRGDFLRADATPKGATDADADEFDVAATGIDEVDAAEADAAAKPQRPDLHRALCYGCSSRMKEVRVDFSEEVNAEYGEFQKRVLYVPPIFYGEYNKEVLVRRFS